MGDRPRIAVFSTLFPSPVNPTAGLFIRERMFRVAQHFRLVVVAPQPWFPFQGIVRRWRPYFRLPAPYRERQSGVEVYRPRYFSVPGLFKRLDGLFMALGALRTLRQLKRGEGIDLIDAHFAYPDGYAASLLGRWLGRPVTVTLRGTETRLLAFEAFRKRILTALARAVRVFSVAGALKEAAVAAGASGDKVRVVGNGVDTTRFYPVDRSWARQQIGIPEDAPVLISVGGLVERKGFHRVIEQLPQLCQRFPNLHYVIVGGGGGEGDRRAALETQAERLGLRGRVRFLGPIEPDRLRVPLSAADVFVLATRNEGWANVFLEAMACGLPVVTTEVGGNAEVVPRAFGTLVPFGDGAALRAAMAEALTRPWDRRSIRAYAERNSWDRRVRALVEELEAAVAADRERMPAMKES